MKSPHPIGLFTDEMGASGALTAFMKRKDAGNC